MLVIARILNYDNLYQGLYALEYHWGGLNKMKLQVANSTTCGIEDSASSLPLKIWIKSLWERGKRA